MTALVRLGVRLAGGGGTWERIRTGSVALACAIGTWVLLTTMAIAAAERGSVAQSPEGRRLLVAVVLVIAMPALVLIATATRLSSTLRDRRLAGLRLLGLSPGGTRLVAGVESGVVAVAGTLAGCLAFWASRPVISQIELAGRNWAQTSFAPSGSAAVAVLVAVPAVAVLVSLVPTRRLGRDLLGQSRPAHTRRPSPWRLLPLAVGGVACLATTWNATGEISATRGYAFFAGVALCALGLVLVVPVFVRLVADLMVRVPGRPTLRIAGRRLQSQPAGVARIVSGLLIGLFVVSGARGVVGAFEDTPQYRSAEHALTVGPAVYLVRPPARIEPAAALATLESVPGVRGVVASHTVVAGCGPGPVCKQAFVGTCADVRLLFPSATGCRDDRVAWFDRDEQGRAVFSWRSEQRGGPEPVRLPAPETVIETGAEQHLQWSIFIPAATPGIMPLAAHAEVEALVVADPGPASAADIAGAINQWGPHGWVQPIFSLEDYQFVAGLRALVWAVAAVVLSVGLLAFAISAIDRAVNRRAEMVSLQLIGTPRSVIRGAQWWEALLPLALGLPGAVLLGWAVGTGYLVLGGSLDASPWQSTLALGAVATAAAVGFAALTVLGSAPRIRAELIRRE